MYITKATTLQLSCHCHDGSYAASPILITTKIPRFHLTQDSAPNMNNLMGTMFVSRKNPCPTQKGCKQGYLVFHRKRLEPRVLPWHQYRRCHFVSFVMYISGAKFEDRCSHISGDILNSLFYYDIITFLICIISNCEKTRYSKNKNAILLYFEKPFKTEIIFYLIIFYFIGT